MLDVPKYFCASWVQKIYIQNETIYIYLYIYLYRNIHIYSFPKVIEKLPRSITGQSAYEHIRLSCEKFPTQPSSLYSSLTTGLRFLGHSVLWKVTQLLAMRCPPSSEGSSLTPTGWLTSLGESLGLEDKDKKALVRRKVLEENFIQQT